jgi:hypothetical protein
MSQDPIQSITFIARFIHHMLENIKEQFYSDTALTSSKNHISLRRDQFPKYYGDLYPIANEYYHELNPFFLFNAYRPDLFKFCRTFTVRDGYVPFTDFILNNLGSFTRLGIGTLLIHPDLTPIVPSNLSSHFGCWNIVQKNQIDLHSARKVIIYGQGNEQYLGDLNALERRMDELKSISNDAEINVVLPIRKGPFEQTSRETMIPFQILSVIKDILPGRNIRLMTNEQFFAITEFRNSYFFDLAEDKFIVSDNFLHYYVQSRGATVNNKSLKASPTDSIFSLDLSLYHELHVTPMTLRKNIFADLLFYRKQNTLVKDALYDPLLQGMLKEMLRS